MAASRTKVKQAKNYQNETRCLVIQWEKVQLYLVLEQIIETELLQTTPVFHLYSYVKFVRARNSEFDA